MHEKHGHECTGQESKHQNVNNLGVHFVPPKEKGKASLLESDSGVKSSVPAESTTTKKPLLEELGKCCTVICFVSIFLL